MRFEIVPIDAVRKMGRGVRMNAETRTQLDELIKKIQESGTEGICFTLDEGESYNSRRTLLRKYAEEKGIHLLFKKSNANTFGCYIPSEEEWQARPKVGMKPGASKGGRPPKSKK